MLGESEAQCKSVRLCVPGLIMGRCYAVPDVLEVERFRNGVSRLVACSIACEVLVTRLRSRSLLIYFVLFLATKRADSGTAANAHPSEFEVSALSVVDSAGPGPRIAY